MIADLGQLVIAEEYPPTQVGYRKPGGAYINGKWVQGDTVFSTVMVSMQPAGSQTMLSAGRELKDMLEGYRDEAQWLMWSRFAVENDDEVQYKGDTYRVLHVWNWLDTAGFCRSALGMLKP